MPVTLLHPYCTLELVQQETQNEDADKEDIMLGAINRASRLVDEICRADFVFHDHSETPLDVGSEFIGGDLLVLPWPILSLTQVEDITSDSPVVIPATEYKVVRGSVFTADPFAHRRGMVVRDGNWPFLSYRNCLRLTGTFGYAPVMDEDDEPDNTQPSAHLPAAVVRATTLIAAAFSGCYNKQWRDASGSTQEMLQTSVPKEARELLARWVRPLAIA